MNQWQVHLYNENTLIFVHYGNFWKPKYTSMLYLKFYHIKVNDFEKKRMCGILWWVNAK